MDELPKKKAPAAKGKAKSASETYKKVRFLSRIFPLRVPSR